MFTGTSDECRDEVLVNAASNEQVAVVLELLSVGDLVCGHMLPVLNSHS